MHTFFWWGPFWIPVVAVGFVLWLVVGFFFLLNLRDLLVQVGPQRRAMEPNQVWLNFIPIFNLFWIFFTLLKVRDSVQAEFQARNWASKGDFGLGLGLAAAIFTILNWGPFGLVALILWIVYWSKTAELKNQLIKYGPYQVPVAGTPVIPPAGGPDAAAGPTTAPPGADAGGSPAAGPPEERTAGAGESEPSGGGAMGSSCPYCGTPYTPGAKFCPGCGRPAS